MENYGKLWKVLSRLVNINISQLIWFRIIYWPWLSMTIFSWHSSRVHTVIGKQEVSFLFYSLWRNSRILSFLKLKQNVRRTSLNCRIGVDERQNKIFWILKGASWASWVSWAPGELSRPAAKERPAPTCPVHTKSAPSIFPSAWRPSIAYPFPSNTFQYNP